jgi:transcriptional regulator with XRE-family HTH domain
MFWTHMNFATTLTTLRHERGITQKQLATTIGIHVSNIRRYEAGTNTPTLDVLRNLALALHVTADQLVFPDNPRGPTAPSPLRLHLEAIDQLTPDEQTTIQHVIEGALLRHQARKIAS